MGSSDAVGVAWLATDDVVAVPRKFANGKGLIRILPSSFASSLALDQPIRSSADS